VLLLALAALPACSRAPADPVAGLLAELTAAAEARDAARFGARLSARFRGDGGLGRPEAIALVRRYFAAYESVAIDVYDVETERDGPAARVRCVAEFSGRARQVLGLPGLLPPSDAYRFTLEVSDEGGTWRVREASWEPAAP
jgi:hypothetical protein